MGTSWKRLRLFVASCQIGCLCEYEGRVAGSARVYATKCSCLSSFDVTKIALQVAVPSHSLPRLNCESGIKFLTSLQNLSLVWKVVFVTLWGKFQLYKYLACWIITVSGIHLEETCSNICGKLLCARVTLCVRETADERRVR